MVPSWLSLIDAAFIGVALLFAWGGSQKGFAEQVAHILTFLIMGVTLLFAYPAMFNYFGGIFRRLNETYLMWLLFSGLFVLAIGVFVLISKMLAGLLKTQISNRSDAVYGFILGLIRGALVCLFFMTFLVMLGPPNFFNVMREKSYVGKTVCYELVPRIQPHLTRSVLEQKVQGLKNKLLEREDAGMLDWNQ